MARIVSNFAAVLGSILLVSLIASAQEGDPAGPMNTDQAARNAVGVEKKNSKKKLKNNPKNKKKARGEKEVEGTEAADRFEANTVIKSQYKLNGEPLEVDPD